MKKSVLVAFLGLIFLNEVSCALITPKTLRKGWQWDGVLRVIPNSMFEPVTKAKDSRRSRTM